MTDVSLNQTKRGNRPAAKKEEQSMENQKPQTLEKIRTELNLEKWPIWKPSHSRNEQKRVEVFERQITLENGSKETAQLIINATGNLNLFTTEDQKTLYVSIKLWQDAGKPTSGIVPFSLRQIAKIKKKKWQQDTLSEIIKSLEKHRGILFKWVHSFYDSATEETLHNLDYFNIFQDLKIAYRTRGDKIGNKAMGYFRFYDLILKNLLNNFTKPLYLDMILEFKSEIAQLLYTRIDLIMANKTHFERRTKELFEDLHIEGKEYKYLSVRKRILEKALKELQGVFLSTGVLLEARLEKTKDEKDYKVVFIKQAFSKTEDPKNRAGDREEEKKEPAFTMPQPSQQALELAQFFHEKLDRPNYQPASRELDQAAALFAECGLDKAKQVISFAISEAQTTNFQMRTFGAIFQYKSEALRIYERQQKEQETLKLKQEQEQQEKKAKAEQRLREKQELDNFYNSLTETEKEKHQILTQQEFKNMFCPTQDPASPFYQSLQEIAKYNALRVLRQDSNLLN